MSTQRGNVKKGKPKHQNSFAFKHNPKSKKTAHILSLPIHGLCKKCHDQIEWRKKYRKYKPRTTPGNCHDCSQKSVLAAYHVLCKSCAKSRDVCAKCCQRKDIIPSAEEEEKEQLKKDKEFEESLEGMREREKRAYLRKLEREQMADEENSDCEQTSEQMDDSMCNSDE